MQMLINGLNLRVETAGEGPPLLLLHGFAVHFQSVKEDFDHFKKAFTVVAFDHRGHGESDKPDAFTMADHIADALAVMDALGHDTFRLHGTAGGAYTAQGVAIAAPERIERLVLIAPKAKGAGSGMLGFQAQFAEQTKGMDTTQRNRFIRSRVLAPTTPERLEVLLEKRAALQGAELTEAQREIAGKALVFDWRADLRKITAPTLVVTGQHDPLCPPEVGKEIADAIPGARFDLFENSGHLPRLEEPERYFATLDAFLA